MLDLKVSYEAVHFRLLYKFGRASEHLCAGCLEPANQWAFLHDAGDRTVRENGSPYSTDLKDYAPMCWSCHTKMDETGFLRGDPSAAGKKGVEAQRLGPRFTEIRSEGGKVQGAKMAKVRRKCNGCDMVSHPVGIGRHQKASGHEGWVAL